MPTREIFTLENTTPLTGEFPDNEPCRLPLVAQVVGFPPNGVSLNAVLHRINYIQRAIRQLESGTN